VHSPFEEGARLVFESVVGREHARDVDRILSGRELPSVEGLGFDGRIRIPELFWQRFEGDHYLCGEATELLLNGEPLKFTPTTQFVTMSLSSTGLALAEKDMLVHSYTGEIGGASSGIENPPVTWSTAHGEMRLVRHYRYRTVLIGGNEATVRIAVPVLTLELSSSGVSPDVVALSEAVRNAADPALRVISYLSRRHVHVLDVAIVSKFVAATHSDVRTFRWMRGAPNSSKRAGVGMMVNPHRMGGSGMAGLLDRLAVSKYRTVVLAAIGYLPSASQARHIESQLLFGFTALETLVNGIHDLDGTHRSLGSAQFARLARKIRESIRQGTGLSGEANDSTSLIEAKLPELNRPPIVAQTAAVVERFNVGFADLFGPGLDLRSGLQGMFRTRNAFLHAGKVESLGRVVVAASRATALAERVIGALIGLDRDWIDSRGEEHYRYLPAQEAALESEKQGR